MESAVIDRRLSGPVQIRARLVSIDVIVGINRDDGAAGEEVRDNGLQSD